MELLKGDTDDTDKYCTGTGGMIPVALKRRNVMNTLNTGTEGPQKVIERYTGSTCKDSYGIGRHKYCTLYRVTVAVQILYTVLGDCGGTDTGTVQCTLYRVTDDTDTVHCTA